VEKRLNFLTGLYCILSTYIIIAQHYGIKDHEQRLQELETTKLNKISEAQKQILDRLVNLSKLTLDTEIKFRRFISDTKNTLDFHDRVHRSFTERLNELTEFYKGEMN